MTETEAHALLDDLYARATAPAPAVPAVPPLHVVSWLSRFGPADDAAGVRAAARRVADQLAEARRREAVADRLTAAVEAGRIGLENAGLGAVDRWGAKAPPLPAGLLPVPRAGFAHHRPAADGPEWLFALWHHLPDGHPLRGLPADLVVALPGVGPAVPLGADCRHDPPAWTTPAAVRTAAGAYRAAAAAVQAERDRREAERRAVLADREAAERAARPVTAGELERMKAELRAELAKELAAG